MLYLKVFLQFSAVASSFAGCYALTTYTIEAVTKNNLFEYFLVDAVIPTSNKEDTNLFNKKTKNYTCELTNKKFDYECELFKLSAERPIAGAKNKSVHLPSLMNKDSLLKEKIEAETYILKLSQNSIYKEIFTSAIFLKSTKNTQKSFASLSINKHLKSSNQETKSRFATVKYVVAGTPANQFIESKEYLCDIGKDKAVPCNLKAFEATTHFYTFEKTGLTTVPNPKALYQYFLLEIREPNKLKTSSEFKESRIKIVEKESPNTTVGTFEFEQLILNNNKETSPTTYFPIIESKTWLVTSTLGSDSRIHEPLLTSTTWQKNYKCKLSSSDKELDCDLYELNYSSTNFSSSVINTKYWQKELMTKDKLITNTFFKLKINTDQLQNFKLDGSETIQVINKTSKNPYSTLTPKFEVKESHIYGKKNLMFGTVNAPLTTSSNTFKCKLQGKTSSEPCDIYKFTTSPNSVAVALFSTTQKVTAASEVVANTKFVVDLKNQNLTTTNDQQAISITVESSPSQTTQFTVEDQLIGIINQSSNNKIILTK